MYLPRVLIGLFDFLYLLSLAKIILGFGFGFTKSTENCSVISLERFSLDCRKGLVLVLVLVLLRPLVG